MALGQPSQVSANWTSPCLGGSGRTLQDSLPREDGDQDRLPGGVGGGWARPGGATSQQPLGMGLPGSPGRSRSAHDGLGVVGIAFFYFLEMPIEAIFSGRGFKYL